MQHILNRLDYWNKSLTFWQNSDRNLCLVTDINIKRANEYIALWNAKARVLVLTTMSMIGD